MPLALTAVGLERTARSRTALCNQLNDAHRCSAPLADVPQSCRMCATWTRTRADETRGDLGRARQDAAPSRRIVELGRPHQEHEDHAVAEMLWFRSLRAARCPRRDTIVLSVAGLTLPFEFLRRCLTKATSPTTTCRSPTAPCAARAAAGATHCVGGEFFFQKRAPAGAASVDRWWSCRWDAGEEVGSGGTSRRCCGWRTSPVLELHPCTPTGRRPGLSRTSCAFISTWYPASNGSQVRTVAQEVRGALADFGLVEVFGSRRHARDRAGSALDV